MTIPMPTAAQPPPRSILRRSSAPLPFRISLIVVVADHPEEEHLALDAVMERYGDRACLVQPLYGTYGMAIAANHSDLFNLGALGVYPFMRYREVLDGTLILVCGIPKATMLLPQVVTTISRLKGLLLTVNVTEPSLQIPPGIREERCVRISRVSDLTVAQGVKAALEISENIHLREQRFQEFPGR